MIFCLKAFLGQGLKVTAITLPSPPGKRCIKMKYEIQTYATEVGLQTANCLALRLPHPSPREEASQEQKYRKPKRTCPFNSIWKYKYPFAQEVSVFPIKPLAGRYTSVA